MLKMFNLRNNNFNSLLIAPMFVYYGTVAGLGIISFLICVILCTFCTKSPILVENDYKLVAGSLNNYYINNSYEINKFFAEYDYEFVVNHNLGRVQLFRITEDFGTQNNNTINSPLNNFNSLMSLLPPLNNNSNNGAVQVVGEMEIEDSFETVETDISAEEKNYFKKNNDKLNN